MQPAKLFDSDDDDGPSHGSGGGAPRPPQQQAAVVAQQQQQLAPGAAVPPRIAGLYDDDEGSNASSSLLLLGGGSGGGNTAGGGGAAAALRPKFPPRPGKAPQQPQPQPAPFAAGATGGGAQPPLGPAAIPQPFFQFNQGPPQAVPQQPEPTTTTTNNIAPTDLPQPLPQPAMHVPPPPSFHQLPPQQPGGNAPAMQWTASAAATTNNSSCGGPFFAALTTGPPPQPPLPAVVAPPACQQQPLSSGPFAHQQQQQQQQQQPSPVAVVSNYTAAVTAGAPQVPPPPQMAPLPLSRTADGVYELPPMPPPPPPTAGLPAGVTASSGGQEQAAWDAFVTLSKQLEDAHARMGGVYAQVQGMQLSHEKEAAAFRQTAQAGQQQLQQELEQTREHYNTCQAKLDSLAGLLNRKAEAIMALEQRCHAATADRAAMAQQVAFMEDKVKIADNARQAAEVRQRELELALEHSVALVTSLRKQLYVASDDKVAALQAQYQGLEANRRTLIDFYTQREQAMLAAYNQSLRQVQEMADATHQQREAHVNAHWEAAVGALSAQYKELERQAKEREQRFLQELHGAREVADAEKEKWVRHMQQELVLLEQRHKEREDHVLVDIARRERELGEREQRQRVALAQQEQDAKVALLSREAELKGYYEKLTEDQRRLHEQDRDRLVAAFREQVGSIGQQHLANERELERLHREKEREMAQRYRIAGYEMDDQRSAIEGQQVTQKTQSSLLSKMDSIEARARDRAEVSRSIFRGASVGGTPLLASPSPASPMASASGTAATAASPPTNTST